MKKLITALSILFSINCFAESKMKLNFKDADITSLIEQYSIASGQKFIIDPSVRGKISIFNPSEVSLEDAFNQISEALALNGFTIIKNGDTMTIRNARSAQRDNIETSTTLPAAKPQRMASWIINLKHTAASDVLMQLRLLTSSYGEMSVYAKNNQLIISDYTSNLQRIAEIIKQVDVPQDPSIAKIVAQAQKERDLKHEKMMSHEHKHPDDSKKPGEKNE